VEHLTKFATASNDSCNLDPIYKDILVGEIEILALSAPLNCTEQRFFLLCNVRSGLILSIQGENGQDYRSRMTLNEA
jgi:hypothetical protein